MRIINSLVKIAIVWVNLNQIPLLIRDSAIFPNTLEGAKPLRPGVSLHFRQAYDSGHFSW